MVHQRHAHDSAWAGTNSGRRGIGHAQRFKQKLLAVLEKRPLKALFLTNLLGFCDDIDEIASICRSKKIMFIEDNCESLGTVYKGKKLGNWGFASTFSFYVGHHMSTVEGGAVVTDSEELDTALQLVRAHGWDRHLTEQKQLKIRLKHGVNETFYSRYTFYDLGYNFRTTEIQGFLGNTQLRYLDEIVKKERGIFMRWQNPFMAGVIFTILFGLIIWMFCLILPYRSYAAHGRFGMNW